MMMRTFIFATCTILLLFGTVTHGAIIDAYQPCGNADTCVSGFNCFVNYCIPYVNTTINGEGNVCSKQDCCGNPNLQCVVVIDPSMYNNTNVTISGSYSICSEKNTEQGLTVLPCEGAPGPAPTGSTFPNITVTGIFGTGSSETGSIGTGSVGSTTGGTSVAPCDNQLNSCASGFTCLANICVDNTVAGGVAAGTGNACESNNCCPSGLVCIAGTKKCGPQVTGLSTISCTGQPPSTTGGTTTGGTVTQTSTGGSLGSFTACTNTANCPIATDVCLANICVSQASSNGAVWGTGNDCSATNCCPNNLACITALAKCGPNVGAPITTCQATGGASSGLTLGPTGSQGGHTGGTTAGTNPTHSGAVGRMGDATETMFIMSLLLTSTWLAYAYHS